MEKPDRQPNRISQYDYSQQGAYFITLCTQNRHRILSKILPPLGNVGTPVPGCPDTGYDKDPNAPIVQLLSLGQIADRMIRQLDVFYTHLSVDKYVIMPDPIDYL